MEFRCIGNDLGSSSDGYGNIVSFGGLLGWDGEAEAKVVAEVEFGSGLEDFAFSCLAVVGFL